MNNVIPLLLFGVLLNAIGQLLMRYAMLQIGELTPLVALRDLPILVTNGWLWLAVVCYAMAMLIWLVVLSRVEVSFAYAFLSLGFVLVTIAGWLFFGESLSVWRIGGIALVCGGLLCIAQS